MSILSALLAVLASGIAPASPATATTVRQRVDLIELNHFVDEEGREVFRQVIFYDWSKIHNRFHVRAWRLIKRESQLPERRWNPDHYQCSWHDDGVLRQVWSSSLRETWTQKDPERVNRGLLPEDQRVPLFAPKVAKREEDRR